MVPCLHTLRNEQRTGHSVTRMWEWVKSWMDEWRDQEISQSVVTKVEVVTESSSWLVSRTPPPCSHKSKIQKALKTQFFSITQFGSQV